MLIDKIMSWLIVKRLSILNKEYIVIHNNNILWLVTSLTSSSPQVQRRLRESERTERALWHWSLTLQAKVTRTPIAIRPCRRPLNGGSGSVDAAAGATRLEAVARRAARQEGAGRQGGPGLQRPAAEGGRLLHPHLRRSDERPHHDPDPIQRGAGVCRATLKSPVCEIGLICDFCFRKTCIIPP